MRPTVTIVRVLPPGFMTLIPRSKLLIALAWGLAALVAVPSLLRAEGPTPRPLGTRLPAQSDSPPASEKPAIELWIEDKSLADPTPGPELAPPPALLPQAEASPTVPARSGIPTPRPLAPRRLAEQPTAQKPAEKPAAPKQLESERPAELASIPAPPAVRPPAAAPAESKALAATLAEAPRVLTAPAPQELKPLTERVAGKLPRVRVETTKAPAKEVASPAAAPPAAKAPPAPPLAAIAAPTPLPAATKPPMARVAPARISVGEPARVVASPVAEPPLAPPGRMEQPRPQMVLRLVESKTQAPAEGTAPLTASIAVERPAPAISETASSDGPAVAAVEPGEVLATAFSADGQPLPTAKPTPAKKTVLRLVNRSEPPPADIPSAADPSQIAALQPNAAPAAPTAQPNPDPAPVDGAGAAYDVNGFNKAPNAADLKRWFKTFDVVGVDIQRERGKLPYDASRRLFTNAPPGEIARLDWPYVEYQWAAPEIWHQPFYFDDVPLERYGQTVSEKYQPWISGVRFYMTLPVMPFKLWADRPYSYISTLGYYRAGAPNPAILQRPEWPPGESWFRVRGGWGVWNREPWPGPGPAPGVVPWDNAPQEQ